MNKKIVLVMIAILMVMSMVANQEFLTVYGYEEDDPRISFDPNGGSGHMETVYYQGNYPLPEYEFTAPEGYRFKCWHRDGDPRELQPGDTVYVANTNDVVSAVWEPIPAKVVFDNGGGEGTMDEVEIYGDYTLPGCEFTAPDGQQFKSWQFDGQEKQPGDSIYVDNIITVTALWENIPTEPPTEAPTEAPTEPPTEAPTLPAASNDTKPVQNAEPDVSDDNAQSDSTSEIAVVLGIVLICAVCAAGGILIVRLVAKKKNK